MGNKGTYIYLDRGILDHWTYKDKPFNRSMAWIDLLLIANHKTYTTMWKGKKTTFYRGDVNLSITELSKRWGWSRGKTRRFILSLEMDGMANIKRTTDGTVITLIKYDNFQSKRTAKRTSSDTTHGTPDGTTDGTQSINDKGMQKEIKESEPSPHRGVPFAEEDDEPYDPVPVTDEEWEALPLVE